MNIIESEELSGLKAETNCAKSFRCLEVDNDDICKAGRLWLTELVECIEESAMECNFALKVESKIFCKCPLRIYLLKNQKR